MCKSIRPIKKSILMVLMAGVMGAGMCAPVMADNNVAVQQKVQEKNPIFSLKGRKETIQSLIGGTISGVIKSALCIYLNNKFIMSSKINTFPLVYALMSTLEAFILKKTLNIAGGVPIRALMASNFVSAVVINPQPGPGATSFSNAVCSPFFAGMKWLFSRSATAPTAVQAAVQTIAPGAQ